MAGIEPAKRECEAARERFPAALEDKAEEQAVLNHCLSCRTCMAAFTELKETVDRLVAAAEAVPKSGRFASSVLASIRMEKAKRRNSRVAAASCAVMAVSAAFVAVAVLATRQAPEPPPAGLEAGVAGPGPAWPETRPAASEPAREPAGQAPESGKAVEDRAKKPDHAEEPAFDAAAVDKAFAEAVNLLKEPGPRPGRHPGQRKRRILATAEKLSSLGQKELAELVRRLGEYRPADEEQKRVHGIVLSRCRERLANLENGGRGK